MKPRTRNQSECVAISKKLPPLTEKQKQYAFDHCFSKQAKIKNKKGDTYCLECGHLFHVDNINAEYVVCPHCHAKLKTDGVMRKQRMESTFQLVTKCNGWQIVRTFEVWKMTHGTMPCSYSIDECIQRFMKPNCKDVVLARPLVNFGRYFDYLADMTIKYERVGVYYTPYDIWAMVVYPYQQLLPIVRRNGFDNWLKKNTSFVTTFHRLVNNNYYETIAKVHRYDIWKELSETFIDSNWYLIKMLIRHNYKPTDFNIWKDNIRFVNELELDNHSPKYVLPTDLKAMHDMLFKRIHAKRVEEEKQRKREQIAKKKAYAREFRKRNAKLLKMVLVVGDITIKPLQNYKDYINEGKAMHHCVETYWMRDESFILSARMNGKRIATIELDRKDFTVKQCRGLQNCIPDQYDQLVSILKRNKRKFLKAAS